MNNLSLDRKKELINYRAGGINMITIMIPYNADLIKIKKLLNNEYLTALNIKSKVNRENITGVLLLTLNEIENIIESKQIGKGIIILKNSTDSFYDETICDVNVKHFLYLCDNKYHILENEPQ